MALAPLAQRGEDGGEVPSGGGEQIVIARRVVAVSPAFDDPGLLKLAQAQREGLSRGAGVDLDVLEPVDAETQLPKNEQAPPLSDELERVSDRADPRSPEISRFAFLTHSAMVAQSVSPDFELTQSRAIAPCANPSVNKEQQSLCPRS